MSEPDHLKEGIEKLSSRQDCELSWREAYAVMDEMERLTKENWHLVHDIQHDMNTVHSERNVALARVAELEAALKPFADWAIGWHANWPDHLAVNETKTDNSPTLGDCRRAAELLKGGAP